jgi:hypothetical protein
MAIQTNNIEIVRAIGDQYKRHSGPAELKELVFKQKDAQTGMSPAKYASKSKTLAREAEKYFKELCKKK